MRELHDRMVKGRRKMMISMIQKFWEATPTMNSRECIHLLVPGYAARVEKLPPSIQHPLTLPPPE